MQRASALFGQTAQAAAYAAHRPAYPPALLQALCEYATAGLGRRPTDAVDVACGSGQASLALARAEPALRTVTAVDGSAAQVAAARAAVAGLADAGLASRLTVLHAAAEDTGLAAGCADLVTIAQALHWTDVPAFYAEAARLLRPGGAVAVISYTWPTVKGPDGRVLPASSAALLAAANGPPLDKFWDAGRAAVDAGLPGMDPPAGLFEAVERREGASMAVNTTAAGVGGYVRSWSAYASWVKSGGGGGGGDDPAAAVVAAVVGEAGSGGGGGGGGGGSGDQVITLEWPVLVLVGRKRAG